VVNKSGLLLEFFRQVILIRYFEEKIDWLFSRNLLPGTAHLCIGQEASAVGAISALSPEDFCVSTHRGHGHLLAKGADPKRLFCEIMGKEPGYCRGLGGTQHLCGMEIAFLGTNGITGGGIPIATGAALALKLKKDKRIVACFFGDGATNQGTFHESLNMASVWKAPVVYICENNLYGMSTPVREAMNVDNIAERAAAYGMPSAIADGMDVLSVREAVLEAVERCRRQEGPTLIELKTYRYCGHSKSDPRAYRSREEEERWRQKDPCITLERKLIEEGIPSRQIDLLKENIRGEVEAACDFALRADYADPELIWTASDKDI